MQANDIIDQAFRLHYEPLFRFCRQYITGDDECHDIVTGAFEEVWRQRDTLREESLRAYLYATVRNRAIDLLRREDKRRRYVEYATVMTEAYVDEDHLAQLERTEHICAEALRRIGPPTSDILKACYLDGKKYKEVAEEMKMSVANVKRHMVKALRMLREMRGAFTE